MKSKPLQEQPQSTASGGTKAEAIPSLFAQAKGSGWLLADMSRLEALSTRLTWFKRLVILQSQIEQAARDRISRPLTLMTNALYETFSLEPLKLTLSWSSTNPGWKKARAGVLVCLADAYRPPESLPGGHQPTNQSLRVICTELLRKVGPFPDGGYFRCLCSRALPERERRLITDIVLTPSRDIISDFCRSGPRPTTVTISLATGPSRGILQSVKRLLKEMRQSAEKIADALKEKDEPALTQLGWIQIAFQACPQALGTIANDALNRYLGAAPQRTLEERQKVYDFVAQFLGVTGAQLLSPKEKLPSYLHFTSSPSHAQGIFRFNVIGSKPQKLEYLSQLKDISVQFPELPATCRTPENEYADRFHNLQ